MDGLEERAFNELVGKGVSFEEADSKASSLSKDIFKRDYLEPLQEVMHKPQYVVEFRGT
jgi:hypothetical protein